MSVPKSPQASADIIKLSKIKKFYSFVLKMIDRYLNITNMYIKLWSDALCVKQIISIHPKLISIHII